MKIKQVEALTGITAKNIRFYEDQGLLSPERNKDNSYRDYSNEDVRLLKIIKVLRKLDLPLGGIREVLSGWEPLEQVMELQAEYLKSSIRELESAQKLCKELADQHQGVQGMNPDLYLERIGELERQGNRFINILDDFRLVADSVEKMRFHFFPDELIVNPQEFTEALVQYALEEKLDLVITKESMYPEFTLNGIEYSAMRYTGRFGSVISVEAVHPELLEPQEVSRQRRWWMEWIWRMAFPLLVVLAFVLISFGGTLLQG